MGRGFACPSTEDVAIKRLAAAERVRFISAISNASQCKCYNPENASTSPASFDDSTNLRFSLLPIPAPNEIT
jgi:hypothetical protein